MKEDMRRTAGPKITAHSTGIRVEIEKHCADKMYGWCRAANTEVSGMGLVRLEKGVFKVYDVFLPSQQCSTGYTELDSEALGRLYTNFMERYGMDKYMAMAGELKFWWHTHYNFNTFWSGTDDNTAQKLAVDAGDWGLSLVINQAGDHLCRADIVTPIPVMVDSLNVNLVPNTKKATKRNYTSDIRKWVRPFPARPKKVWTPSKQIVTSYEPYAQPENVNFGGTVMPKETMDKLMSCPCGDWTCIDCKDTINLLKVGKYYV